MLRNYGKTAKAAQKGLKASKRRGFSRLTSWGFNFLSSPSAILLRRGLPHAHVLGIGQQFATYGDEFDILLCDGGPCSGFPNVFPPLWREFCRFRAEFVGSGLPPLRDWRRDLRRRDWLARLLRQSQGHLREINV